MEIDYSLLCGVATAGVATNPPPTTKFRLRLNIGNRGVEPQTRN